MSSTRHVEGVLQATPQQVTEDLMERTSHVGSRFWLAVLVLAGLLVLGIIGFIIRLSDGFSDHTRWGYYAAIFAYILTTAQAAPLVAIALRALKTHWRRPLSRAAELFAVVGVFNLLLYIPLMMVLPVTDGRRTIWVNWPGHSPHVYDTLAMVFLVLCGLALLYVSALPDIAAGSKKLSGIRGSLLRKLTLSWQGTAYQWRIQRAGIGILGGLYFMFLVFTHFLIASDFAMSLVPGWKDSIFPPWHALGALQAGLATVMVTMFVLRVAGGYREYIGLNQFWSLSKILLALTLLWAYFWFSGFLTFWYGRQPIEQNIIRFLFVESYRVPFLLAIIFNFVTPFALLLWNGVRKSILGPTLAAASILVGTFFDRIRIYVASMSVQDITAHELESLPAPVLPEAADVLILIGGIGGALLVYLLATKVLPVVSLWETKEGLLYQIARPMLRARYMILGKPE